MKQATRQKEKPQKYLAGKLLPHRLLPFHLLLLTFSFLLFPSLGCVRRTLTINTAPQGAAVNLNDELIGTTPVSVDFTWYGDYDVVIRLEGYETLSTNRRIRAPWYQVPPIDFVAEVLVPFTIHDRHELFFELEPRRPIDRDQLLHDAIDFRERTLFEDELTASPPAEPPPPDQPPAASPTGP